MTIKSISYQKAFVIGPYLQERIGVEIELSDTDDPDKAFQLAQEMTNDFHKKANPHLYLNGVVLANELGEITVERPHDVKKALMQDMRSCQEIKVLESYRLLAKSDPELQLVYDQKMKELTQKQKA
jgi:hypothetical protein